jgi:hypothetical protein
MASLLDNSLNQAITQSNINNSSNNNAMNIAEAFLLNMSNSHPKDLPLSPLASPNTTFSFSCTINSEPTEIIQIHYTNCILILITQSALKIGSILSAAADLSNELAHSNDSDAISYSVQTLLGARPSANIINNDSDALSLPELYELCARQLIHQICTDSSSKNDAGSSVPQQLVLAIAFNKAKNPDIDTVKQILTVIQQNKIW